MARGGRGAGEREREAASTPRRRPGPEATGWDTAPPGAAEREDTARGPARPGPALHRRPRRGHRTHGRAFLKQGGLQPLQPPCPLQPATSGKPTRAPAAAISFPVAQSHLVPSPTFRPRAEETPALDGAREGKEGAAPLGAELATRRLTPGRLLWPRAPRRQLVGPLSPVHSDQMAAESRLGTAPGAHCRLTAVHGACTAYKVHSRPPGRQGHAPTQAWGPPASLLPRDLLRAAGTRAR